MQVAATGSIVARSPTPLKSLFYPTVVLINSFDLGDGLETGKSARCSCTPFLGFAY